MGKPDIGLFFGVDPPLIVPISKRAVEFFQLPDGYDCTLYIEEDPADVLKLFPENWIVVTLEEYTPNSAIFRSINRLH